MSAVDSRPEWTVIENEAEFPPAELWTCFMTVCEMRTFQSIVAGTAMYGAAYLAVLRFAKRFRVILSTKEVSAVLSL
jgi:hypothetical protein